jgi:molybdopterin/thiamine biosynthesis adenylyltransferase/nitroreductase
MGGVGGFHLLTLARLGIGSFSIADFDRFEAANFNRQTGATVRSLGRPKVEVLEEMARDINPGLRVSRFDRGVEDSNIDAFLAGADLFIDGFDFFVLDIRRKVFARCRELGIPALTAAPVGMGVGLLVFTKDGMSFEDYFRFEGQPELRQYVHFLLGVAPRGLHRSYLVDPDRLDFSNRKAPSTVIGCELCASATAAAVVKLLLRRGEVLPAPYHHHYDAYLGKAAVTRLPQGNASTSQRNKADQVQRAFEAMLSRPPQPEPAYPASTLEEILDFARWAPSGDNAQPWRFEVLGEDGLAVHIADESSQNVYEYRGGEPTLISAGVLLETLRLSATRFQRRMAWRYDGRGEHGHRLLVHFVPDETIAPDSLSAYVAQRSVNRWPYRTASLSATAKNAVEQALGPDLRIVWHESTKARWEIARLNGKASDIRLRIPEAYGVHQRIIDWTRNLSPTGIPSRAIGLDAMTLKIMRWAMREWANAKTLNRIAGTAAAVFQMDYLPGMCSSAYFTMSLANQVAPGEARVQALLDAGQSVQRFWLTATKLGLAMQPCLATLAFAHYGATGEAFTTDTKAIKAAARLASAAASSSAQWDCGLHGPHRLAARTNDHGTLDPPAVRGIVVAAAISLPRRAGDIAQAGAALRLPHRQEPLGYHIALHVRAVEDIRRIGDTFDLKRLSSVKRRRPAASAKL